MVHRAPDTPELRRRNAVRIAVATLSVLTLAAITVGVVTAYRSQPSPVPASAADTDRAELERAARAGARTAASASATPSASTLPSATPSASVAPPSPTATRATPRATRTTSTATVPAGCTSYSGNRRTACALLPSFGFAISQMTPLDELWERESDWDHLAENPSSGAYGIPQALPGDKMASVAADWRTNPVTQIRWGLGYIRERYGSPAEAWSFWQANGWY